MAYHVHFKHTKTRLIPGERPTVNAHTHTAIEPPCGVPDRAKSATFGLPVSTQGGSLVRRIRLEIFIRSQSIEFVDFLEGRGEWNNAAGKRK